MNTSEHKKWNFDPIDKLIFEDGLKIKSGASLKNFVFFTSTLSLLQKRRVSGVFRDVLCLFR